MTVNFGDTLPLQTWEYGICSPSNLWSTDRSNPPNLNPETENFPESFSNPLALNFWLGTEDFESWQYMNHRPQPLPLVLPNSLDYVALAPPLLPPLEYSSLPLDNQIFRSSFYDH
jgi:hypothetical protein